MKIYNMNYIQKKALGNVNFEITNAHESKFASNNIEYHVYNLVIKLTDQNGTPHNLPKFTMFIDPQNLSFTQFVREYCSVIDSKGFAHPDQLIGITGQANHYVNKKQHDVLTNWIFDIPSTIAQPQLQQHVSNNQQATQNIQFNNHSPFNNNHNYFNQQHQTEFHQTDADVVENPEFYGNPWEGQEND
ncbi:hypothetical protein L2Z53_00240 [Macrococcoides canis]|uniref:hypothetical protein n=1 Tax=Macrococcoides canis TaxID=1855823 RepID=UPI001F227A28|nr:hypothetical protein [Macrococcus canis]UJS27824.1 hypothetical protein L2Z53_00240 [Macrococcus canis]